MDSEQFRPARANRYSAGSLMTSARPAGSQPPSVSVLLTAYNREEYVAESIESVLAQSYTDFELIIVDDASSDRTLAVIERYSSADPRVKVVANDRNLGQFANRKKAASLARGRFLKYHDSDDVMYRHCLMAMVEPLEAEPRAAFALSGSRHWPGGPCPMLLTPALAYEREFLGSGLFQLGPSSALFRTEAFRLLGGFPDRGVASDYLFWLDACARVSVLLVPGDLFYYRIHGGQALTAASSLGEYARASTDAWQKLIAADCPLTGARREQAKRNFLFTQARGAWRLARQGRIAPALMVLRHAGASPFDWLRYLRPPRRSPAAGTPRAEARA
jgi:cellulose synthase/poly-beta-1,6-N-acetylglucosamine synthase-like glycosyltransferase